MVQWYFLQSFDPSILYCQSQPHWAKAGYSLDKGVQDQVTDSEKRKVRNGQMVVKQEKLNTKNTVEKKQRLEEGKKGGKGGEKSKRKSEIRTTLFLLPSQY